MESTKHFACTVMGLVLLSGCMLESPEDSAAVGTVARAAIVHPALAGPLEPIDMANFVQIGSEQKLVVNYMGRVRVGLAGGEDAEAAMRWRMELAQRAGTDLLRCQTEVHQANPGTCIGFGNALYVGYCEAPGTCQIQLLENHTSSRDLPECARRAMRPRAQEAYLAYVECLHAQNKKLLPDGRFEFRLPALYAAGDTADTDCKGTCSSDSGCFSQQNPNCHCHTNQGRCAPGGT